MIRFLYVVSVLFVATAAYSKEIIYIDHTGANGAPFQLALHHTKGSGVPVLYIHGSSFPIALSSEWGFSDGTSWADDLAKSGFDAWGLDFVGYGHSTRPDYTSVPDSFGRSDHAAQQIMTAVNFISDLREGARVSIIAHSWGTVAAGRFASLYPENVGRLVLFGPIVPRLNKSAAQESQMLPYKLVTPAQQRTRFLSEVPDFHAPVLEEPDLAEWGQAYLASDPTSRNREPFAVQVPSGPIKDAIETWSGRWLFEPSKITVPTLIIRGEWDTASTDLDVQHLYKKLGAKEKPIMTIPKATHLMHLEKARALLWRESRIFLSRTSLAR